MIFHYSSLVLCASPIAFSWRSVRRYDVVGAIDFVGVVMKTEVSAPMRYFRLYWTVTRRSLVVSNRRFGTKYRFHLQG